MASALRFAGDANAARDVGFVGQVKAALDLPPDAELELQRAIQDARGESVVEYAVTRPIKLEGAEFGAADGVVVDERVTASLRFDARGVLVSSQVTPIDERHLRSVKDQIRKLSAAGEIYLAQPGEAIDPDELRARRKPWYVETDAQGRKRLKRAYLA